MKLAKLSLAALVAVGAFSVANATSLESAIKGVDVSGYIRYRYYNEDNNVPGHKTDRHRFTVPVLFKVPVADKMTAAVGMFAQENDYATTGHGGTDYWDNSFNLSRMWFQYADNGLSLKLGRQLVATPLTEGGITGSYGDGAVLLYSPAKNLTLAAAAFVKTNQATGDSTVPATLAGPDGIANTADDVTLWSDNDNIYAAAAIGSFSGINAQLWAFKVNHLLDNAIFLQLGGSYEGFSLVAQGSWTKLTDDAYAKLGPKSAGGAGIVNKDTGAFYGVKASYSFDMAKVCAGYTTTNKDNGIYTLDADGQTIHAGKQIYYKTTNARDTDLYFVAAKTSYDAYNFGIGYAGASSVDGTPTDGANEIWVDVGYAFNKKMKVSAYYSALDMDNVGDDVDGGDNNEFRLEVKYSF